MYHRYGYTRGHAFNLARVANSGTSCACACRSGGASARPLVPWCLVRVPPLLPPLARLSSGVCQGQSAHSFVVQSPSLPKCPRATVLLVCVCPLACGSGAGGFFLAFPGAAVRFLKAFCAIRVQSSWFFEACGRLDCRRLESAFPRGLGLVVVASVGGFIGSAFTPQPAFASPHHTGFTLGSLLVSCSGGWDDVLPILVPPSWSFAHRSWTQRYRLGYSGRESRARRPAKAGA